jgi:hypothetical protein
MHLGATSLVLVGLINDRAGHLGRGQVGSSRDLLAWMNLPYGLRAEVIQLEYGGVLGLWEGDPLGRGWFHRT